MYQFEAEGNEWCQDAMKAFLDNEQDRDIAINEFEELAPGIDRSKIESLSDKSAREDIEEAKDDIAKDPTVNQPMM